MSGYQQQQQQQPGYVHFPGRNGNYNPPNDYPQEVWRPLHNFIVNEINNSHIWLPTFIGAMCVVIAAVCVFKIWSIVRHPKGALI